MLSHNKFLSFNRETIHLGIRSGILGTILSLWFVLSGSNNVALIQAILGMFIVSIIEAAALTFTVKTRLIITTIFCFLAGFAGFIGCAIADNFLLLSLILLIFTFMVGVTSSETDLTAISSLFIANVVIVNSGFPASTKDSFIYAASFTLGGLSLVFFSYIHSLFYYVKYSTKDLLIYRQRKIFNYEERDILFAIRISVAVFLANAISHFFNLPEGYWAPMTALLILKIDHDFSWERISHRFFGTIWGSVLAIILISIIHSKVVLAFLMFPALFFIVISIAKHYGAYVFFLTAMVTILFNMINDYGTRITKERILDTVLGVAAVILVIYLFMPLSRMRRKQNNHDSKPRNNIQV